jgi:hypothetical protein
LGHPLPTADVGYPVPQFEGQLSGVEIARPTGASQTQSRRSAVDKMGSSLRGRMRVSETGWNLRELREHYRDLSNMAWKERGERLSSLPNELISSVSRAIDIFRYHLFLARDAVKGILNEADPTGQENFLFVLGASDNQDEFEQAKVVSEANVIGCMHAARSMVEIFAQLVNELALAQKLAVEKCSVYKVRDGLPASRLKTELEVLTSSDAFEYVSGFINTTKHRQLVPHVVSISFQLGGAGLQLGQFEYDKTVYPSKDIVRVRHPSKSVTEVLQSVLVVANALVTAGQALNDYVIRSKK